MQVPLPELIEQVRPFVEARINRKRTPYGRGYEPRLDELDIYMPGVFKRDADVRAAGPDGITVYFYGRCTLFPWTDVLQLDFRRVDADGWDVARRTVHLQGESA